jgi:outer membrane protein
MKLLSAVLVACALTASVPAAAADKIAYVDLQRALNEVEEGAAAKKALKAEFDGKQKTLDDKQNELKKMKDELDARGTMMKPEVKQEKVAELQKRLLEVQQMYFAMQQELTKRESEVTGEIFKKMGVILQTMGQEQEFDMIVEKTAIIYAKPSLDVTNELIRRYNDAYGKSTTKKKK